MAFWRVEAIRSLLLQADQGEGDPDERRQLLEDLG
jgi:hypothetical protein